jgi:methionine--tRNA ligase beta chain
LGKSAKAAGGGEGTQAATSASGGGGGGGEKNAKTKGKEKAPEFVEDPNQIDFTKIDLRVGVIVKVWEHESADRLYCEEIDIGDGNPPRPVASGLRQHYTLEQMTGKRLIVVCNLKEAKMQGFVSTGMVLAAKSSDGARVELVAPPEGAAIGERVYLEGVSGESWPSSRVKNKKVWEAVAPDLRTNDACCACWQGQPLLTSAGPCTVVSLADAQIS